MTDQEHHHGSGEVRHEGEALIIEGRIDELDRKAREAEKRDKEYKDAQIKLDGQMVKLTAKIARFTGLLALCAIVTGGISLWQTNIAQYTAETAKLSADAAKKSADDTHRLLASSDAAFLTVNAQLVMPPYDVVRIIMEHGGKVAAKNPTGKFTISVRTYSGSTIFSSEPVTVADKPILRPNVGDGIFKDFKIKRFDYAAYTKLKYTVRVEGTYSYDNGFGDIVSFPFCEDAVPVRQGIGKYGAAGFMPCTMSANQIRIYLQKDRDKEQ